jgi:hypothetical protein
MMYSASYAFWVLAPYILCTLINTFVWGYIGDDAKLRKVAGAHRGLLSHLHLEEFFEEVVMKHGERDTTAEIELSSLREGVNPIVGDVTELRDSTVRSKVSSRLTPSVFKTLEDASVKVAKADYLPHLPARLQCANAVGRVGPLSYVTKLLIPKMLIMIKLSLGWWDTDVLMTYDITGLGLKFDVDSTDDTMNHTDLMSYIGTAHSIFWQMLPFCAIVAKAAEAFNAVPLFIAWDNPYMSGALNKQTNFGLDFLDPTASLI